MNVTFIGDSVTLEGEALQGLNLPDEFKETKTTDGRLRWEGKISEGGQIALEKKAE
jgi:hypothetical protein